MIYRLNYLFARFDISQPISKWTNHNFFIKIGNFILGRQISYFFLYFRLRFSFKIDTIEFIIFNLHQSSTPLEK